MKWLVSKGVHLLSSCDNGISATNLTRRKKGESEKITLKCPTVVKFYNGNMGGVVKHDCLKVERSKARFYLHIAFDKMDHVVNANILYNSIDCVQKILD